MAMSTHFRTFLLSRTLLAIALTIAVAPAAAQKAPSGKKIYCWDERGERVCSDSLPASAVDNARTEFSPSGIATARVERAKTGEERAIAELEAKRHEQAQWSEADHARREQAMVASFASEADLQRNFEHRIDLIDSAIQTSRLGIDGARRSLLNLLQRASESELDSTPVAKPLAERITSQHDALRQHQRLLERQLQERGTIDQELSAALERYHELKAVSTGTAGRS